LQALSGKLKHNSLEKQRKSENITWLTTLSKKWGNFLSPPTKEGELLT
jgi:hypothetical protein